jgi:F-type H+-transporting ATPase subunit b
MEATLHALGGLLLRAVPTLILIVLLDFYLKGIFFRPLEKVLEKRYLATDGARKLAAESLEKATARTADYEAAMRSARAEIYQTQEKLHRELQDRAAAQVAESRKRAEESVRAERERLGAEMEQAKAGLAAESEKLAGLIADSILRRSAA